MTRVDVWNVVALQERQIRSIEKLWKLNLIERSPKLALLVACYRVSNSILKTVLKMKVRLYAFSLRRNGWSQPGYSRERVIPLDSLVYTLYFPYDLPLLWYKTL
jgi:hypothetical protein